MDLHSWKLTVLTVCLLITGMVIPASAFAPSVDTQYDIYEELTIDVPENDLYVPGEIIVKFTPGISEEKIANINARNGAKVKYTSEYAGFKVLKIPENKNARKMVEVYSKNPNVEYAVTNAVMTASAVDYPVNDYFYYLQWNLHDSNGINVEPAWEMSTGEGVVVAILDTGVAQNAPDLANTNFVSGYDFINGDNDPTDDNRHGTHVAGTIAQSTNNGIGVAGVAYDCSIMPVKVLDAQGSGDLAKLIDGITFATNNGADVISMSLGFPPGSYPGPALDAALEDAYLNGVTIVAAAGNDETGIVSYPAAYDKCIAVGATGYDGQLAYYSNYGDAIDVVAPGGNMLQDLNSDTYGDGILQNTLYDDGDDGFAYLFLQGTSMATPHVSGVAALLISMDPSATNDDIRTALESSARDLGEDGWDSTYGYGLIDAKAALDYLNTEPVPNNPPVANAGGSYNGVVGTEIIFDGSGSYDLDGTIDSYVWDFGDESVYSSTDSNTTRIYDKAGEYSLALTVTDNDGAQDTNITTITVIDIAPENIAPIASINGPYHGFVGTPIEFSSFGSYDPDGIVISYNWSFGDGYSSTDQNPTHTYTTNENYTATLTVTDNAGAQVTDEAQVTINVPDTSVEEISIGNVTVNTYTKKAGKNTFVSAKAVVNIVDKNGSPVEGATVSGQWSGSARDTDYGTTDTSGKVTLTSDAVKYKGKLLTFTFVVNDVTHAVYEWDGSTLSGITSYPQ